MRTPIPKTIQAQVFVRDRWTCRYCGVEVIFSPALKALENLSPSHGYYDQHGSQKSMAKFLLDRCACVDHIQPVTLGGTNDINNLVCACWKCNLAKSDAEPSEWIKKLDTHGPTPTDGWDGMYSLLEKLEPKNEWVQIVVKAKLEWKIQHEIKEQAPRPHKSQIKEPSPHRAGS